MGYLKDMYGYQTEAFAEGVIAGIEAFAPWRGGKQVVGIHQRPIAEVIEEVKKDLIQGYKKE